MLAGLTNKYNIWASTLDKADVDVMHERIENGANLLEEHVFQFDFLNDDFTPKSQGGKLPDSLWKIIQNENERKKLIIYINPPYAEAGSKTSEAKTNVTTGNKIYNRYKKDLSKASNELFALFLIRISQEIQCCKIANFATLKALSASNFAVFRKNFLAKLEKLFLVPANTFDNVKGQFPIGFHIWDTQKKEVFREIRADVFDENGDFLQNKAVLSCDNSKYISEWFFEKLDEKNKIGHLSCRGSNDFQGSSTVFINSYLITLTDRTNRRYRGTLNIDAKNLIKTCIFFAVRHCIPATWLNDRDQFLYPNNKWETDTEFQSDCLSYTLFSSSNNISSKFGTNHWIPFTENEVNSREKFDSNFMSDFIKGKVKFETNKEDLFAEKKANERLVFSNAAQAVFDAGRELWTYYHKQKHTNANASYYDIREFFQGRNASCKMNNKSADETYNLLITNLRQALKVLAKKIEPKVYEYGFLRR